MAVKPFDIVINSKYRSEGNQQAATQLEKLSKTLNKVFNVQAARMVANAVLDMSRAADPERWERIDMVFANLQVSAGKIVNQFLGPMLDLVERIGKQANTALSPSGQSKEFFDYWIKQNKAAGVSADEMARRLKAQSDAAEELGQKAKEAGQLPFWINVKEFGIDAGQMRSALADQSKTFSEYIQALRLAGVEIKNIEDEFKRFASLKNIKFESPFGDLKKGAEDMLAGMKSIEQQTTEFRTQASLERTQLLQNLAISEGRRLEDVARANARQLQQIEQQRLDALQAATTAYNASLAQIAQDSADEKVRIEEDYQERIRQINESSSASIEDAIERRDARALSKALQARSQQLNQAESDHAKQQQAADRNAEKQRQQAEAQYAASQKAAQDAARAALDAQRQANAQAAQDAEISRKRSLQDFELGKLREKQALLLKLKEQYTVLQNGLKQQQALYKQHLADLNSITAQATRPNSTLAQAIKQFVNDAIGDVLGELSAHTWPQRGR